MIISGRKAFAYHMAGSVINFFPTSTYPTRKITTPMRRSACNFVRGLMKNGPDWVYGEQVAPNLIQTKAGIEEVRFTDRFTGVVARGDMMVFENDLFDLDGFPGLVKWNEQTERFEFPDGRDVSIVSRYGLWEKVRY